MESSQADYESARAALVRAVAGFREHDGVSIDEGSVDAWARQFDSDVRAVMVGELAHVLGSTYWSRDRMTARVDQIIKGGVKDSPDPAGTWKEFNFLNIQPRGESQNHLLEVYDHVLHERFGLQVADCGQGERDYIYVDDIMFTGSRVKADIESWILTSAPSDCSLRVALAASHALGQYQVETALRLAIAQSGKNVRFSIDAAESYENRKAFNASSDVLWPAEVPDEAQAQAFIAAARPPFTPRSVGPGSSVYSSEKARQVLERELCLAGLKIIDACRGPNPNMRPLGFRGFGFGFGALTATYRNCPNNAPLALWWGNPDAPSSHPFSKWTPLLPRRQNDLD